MSVRNLPNRLELPVTTLPGKPNLGGLMRWVFWMILFLGALPELSAQCNLVCKAANPDAPVRVGVGANGLIVVVDTLIQVAEVVCPGPKTIIIRDRLNRTVVMGSQPLTFSARPYIGQTLTVTILDQNTSIFCTGYLQPIDVTPPVISCVNATVPCNADTSAAVLGRPPVLDNVFSNIRLTFSDFVTVGRCGSDTAALIRRVWSARDSVGNLGTCTQNILLTRINGAAIRFPRDTTLSCNQPNTRPRLTGFPTVGGRQIPNNGFCTFGVTFTEDSLFTCDGGGRNVTRRWTLRDGCTGQVYNHTQIIQVRDLTPPVITCPPTITVKTNGGGCTGTVNLPRPTITDNCDPNPLIMVATSYGAVGLGPHYGVPEGAHTIQFTAIDRCGNTSVCLATLIVEDAQVPTAVCPNKTIVSLPDEGVAVVMARSFDEGSKDNCNRPIFYKIKRVRAAACNRANGDDSPAPNYQEWFDDWATFCCADRDSGLVLVTLRVYDVDPGSGPVDPAREQNGGDLYGHYNDCTSAVEVRDQLPPRIVCPENRQINCNDDYSDLARYGKPLILENCGYVLDSTARFDQRDCGRGLITRTWFVTDYQGLTASCSQTIELVNNNVLTADMIVWPKDFTSTAGCGAKTDPKDLPAGFREPTITRALCGTAAVSREDKLFDAGYPSCYKILRTWTVIDWCNYNPNVPNSPGRFTHTQTIVVEDREAPLLNLPADITVAVSDNCTTARVNLPAATATDCSTAVTITNESRFAALKTGDASGEYPLGTTIVNYRAVDPCGNVANGKVRVTVVDLKGPELVCINKVSINMVMENGQPKAWVDARAFDAGTLDACTPKREIKLAIRKGGGLTPTTAPTTEILTFTCDEIGLQPIELWGTDLNGNSDYCRTFVDVQDNNNICPRSLVTGKISGAIKTAAGLNVESVKMTLEGPSPAESTSNVSGDFAIGDVPLNRNYTLKPYKNDDILNGVSTIDVILIQKHILGLTPLETPYQLIAADVDRSGVITTLDIIKLRKVVLGYDREFSNGNTSWRFIDAKFQFPAGQDPLKLTLPEAVTLNNFRDKNMRIDFIAIKVGDVNGSARPNSLIGNEGRTTNGEITLVANNHRFAAGETFEVQVRSTDIAKLQGYQFTLNVNPKLLKLQEVIPGELPNLNTQNFGLAQLEEGILATSWNSQGAEVEAGNLQLFTLRFVALRESDLVTALTLAEDPTPSEAYNKAGEQLQVLLELRDPTGAGLAKSAYTLYQNYPNPFREATTIGFTLPTAQMATLSVYDQAGRMVYRQAAAYAKGYNEVQLNRNVLNNQGIYYYRLETADFTETRKMVLAVLDR